MPDQFDLKRFVIAQDAGGTYENALEEIRAGGKRSHWMWFVFPQLQGLGRSATARHYEIASLAEARAYLGHPVLGDRLRACAEALAELPGSRSAQEIFGGVDALKLRSSMTLFARAGGGDGRPFATVLERYHGGRGDPATEGRLGPLPKSPA